MMHPELFSSIPRADPYSMFRGGRPDGQQITKVMKLRTKDVARATHLSEKSIRYDLRMPETLENWLRDVAITTNLVAEFFEGDQEKTQLWFDIANPMLGNVTPRDLIKMGRVKKLLTFVQTALEQNRR